MKMQTPQNLHCLQLHLWQLHGRSCTRVCVGFIFFFNWTFIFNFIKVNLHCWEFIVYILNDYFHFLTTVGCSLKSLDLDSCTLSEILRLHILASGADVTSANAKYRYQKRGGFDATDDACMELRLSNPSLVKKLSSTSVYDLTPGNFCRLEFV